MNGSKMVLQQCLACNTLVSVIIDNKYVLSCFCLWLELNFTSAQFANQLSV